MLKRSMEQIYYDINNKRIVTLNSLNKIKKEVQYGK